MLKSTIKRVKSKSRSTSPKKISSLPKKETQTNYLQYPGPKHLPLVGPPRNTLPELNVIFLTAAFGTFIHRPPWPLPTRLIIQSLRPILKLYTIGYIVCAGGFKVAEGHYIYLYYRPYCFEIHYLIIGQIVCRLVCRCEYWRDFRSHYGKSLTVRLKFL